jgi:signal transduction histidine kinase
MVTLSPVTIATLKHLYAVSCLVTSLSTLCLGLFVFLRARRTETIRLYFFWTISIALWAACLCISIFVVSEVAGVFWCRALHFFALFIPPTCLHFILSLREASPKQIRVLRFVYVATLFFIVADFTPWFLTARYVKSFDFIVTRPQVLYPFHILLFIGTIGYAIFVLFRCYLESSTEKKKHFLLLLWGTMIGYSGGISNYLINYDVVIFPFYPFGNTTIIPYVIAVAFAIVRYRFFDIEVIIRKTLVFAGLVLMVMAIVGTVTSLTHSYIGEFLKISSTISTILSVLVAILLYDPTRRLLVNLTDNYLFQKKFDYQKLLKDASEGIAQIKSLQHLLSLVTHFITMRVRVKNAAVLIYDVKNHDYRFAYSRGYEKAANEWLKGGHTFLPDDPLIDYLKIRHQAVDFEKIKNQIERGNGRKAKGAEFDYQAIKARMEELQAVCAVPSFLSDRLLGILVLGEKKTGDPYSEQDLDVLYTIAQESAIAIENARLYDEAIEKAKELEQINIELNTAQTKMIRALKEVEQANEKLQITQASLIVAEKSATMVGMAKAIGHEVNNPLSIIIGRGESLHKYDVKKLKTIIEREAKKLLPEDAADLAKIADKFEDNLARMVRSGNRIDVAVKTLTNLLKDTKGEMHSLSLIVLCREAIEATRFSTYEENIRGCQIKESIASNIVITGNLEQLIQVFVNLIKNAYEAMEGQKDRQIEIRGDVDPENPKMARIDFIDNGPGIPPEVLPRIWGQGFSTKARKDDSIGAAGQGQGLFVVKHMIESIHKGSITAESVVGKGTTFIIRLPLAEGQE